MKLNLRFGQNLVILNWKCELNFEIEHEVQVELEVDDNERDLILDVTHLESDPKDY